MKKLIVEGGIPLYGTVQVSGAKNAALPILAACLLSGDTCIVENVPRLDDISTITKLLAHLGARVQRTTDTRLEINCRHLTEFTAEYDLVRKMRASFLVTGPLLARTGKARVSLPGGCAIGNRPVDLHMRGLEALGAKVVYGNGYVEARAERLVGTRIYLDYPSVGATENLMMAACLAKGVTVIENAAEEPELENLADFLRAMGAEIKGAGTREIEITGRDELTGCSHTVIPDRIEAGTYLLAGAMTHGSVKAVGAREEHLSALLSKLKSMGCWVEHGVDSDEKGDGGQPWVSLASERNLKACDATTLPYPGFPTDLQPQLMACLTVANGTGIITETIFENRYMQVDELRRMGADIKVEGRVAIVKGVDCLTGANVKATDLRAGACLVLAALAARGETHIHYAYHIDRGYENLEAKIESLGGYIGSSASDIDDVDLRPWPV
jgi:UDP-N-acetylglucosamine 1-carboxyvinyltransferase